MRGKSPIPQSPILTGGRKFLQLAAPTFVCPAILQLMRRAMVVPCLAMRDTLTSHFSMATSKACATQKSVMIFRAPIQAVCGRVTTTAPCPDTRAAGISLARRAHFINCGKLQSVNTLNLIFALGPVNTKAQSFDNER